MKDVLRVNDLPLNFGVLSAVSVTSTINTDDVSKHKRELASIIKLLINVLGNVVVERVKVTYIEALILLMAFEVLAEHRRPDIVTVEDYIVSLAVPLLELMEHVVLFHFAGAKLFRSLKEVGDASTEHTLDPDSSDCRHFRSKWE